MNFMYSLKPTYLLVSSSLPQNIQYLRYHPPSPNSFRKQIITKIGRIWKFHVKWVGQIVFHKSIRAFDCIVRNERASIFSGKVSELMDSFSNFVFFFSDWLFIWNWILSFKRFQMVASEFRKLIFNWYYFWMLSKFSKKTANIVKSFS